MSKCCGSCAGYEPNIHSHPWRGSQCWADVLIELPASFMRRDMGPNEGADCPIWKPVEPPHAPVETDIPFSKDQSHG